MTGHLLGHPTRWATRRYYVAVCGCGLEHMAPTLPRLWALHDRHLAATRQARLRGMA